MRRHTMRPIVATTFAVVCHATASSAATMNAGPVPNGGGSQTFQCTITNMSDLPRAIQVRVYDLVGTVIGNLNVPQTEPGRTIWIGVNSTAATRCRFDTSSAATDYIATGCLKTSVEEVTTACVNAVPVAEEFLPPGRR